MRRLRWFLSWRGFACSFLQVFIFNRSQILVQVSLSSKAYMNKSFLSEQKCSLGEQKCSLDDRLGELYCSERLLDQLCWVMIILVNRSVLLLNFCMRLFFTNSSVRGFFNISPFHAKFWFQRVFSFFAWAYILISNQDSSY